MNNNKLYPFETPAWNTSYANEKHEGSHKENYVIKKEEDIELNEEERINKVKEGILDLLKKYNCSLTVNLISNYDIFSGSKTENCYLFVIPLKEKKDEQKNK